MAAPSCFTNCTPADLLGLPTPNCDTGLRRTTPSRLLMYNCDVDIPTSGPGLNEAIKDLFDTGKIVASMPLSNIVFEDPTYQEEPIDDCQPPVQLLVGRAMTFEDKYAIDSSAASPYVTNKFFDYNFWVDKLDHQRNIRFMIAYCNGDVRMVDFIGSLRGFVNYIKPTQVGSPSTETKMFRLLFNGDPLDMRNPPFFNLGEAGIDL